MQSFSSLVSNSWPNNAIQLLVTATLAISVLLVVLYWGAANRKGRRRMPPGPRPWPVIGNLALIGTIPHQDFQKLAKEYGPIYRLRLGSKETFVVSSPRIAEEVLKKNDIAFASRPQLSQFTILGHNRQTVITAPYGPFWRYARKVFSLELMTHQRIQQFQVNTCQIISPFALASRLTSVCNFRSLNRQFYCQIHLLFLTFNLCSLSEF